MFKALLAASVAMFGCCVAAAWAGPVQPELAGTAAPPLVARVDHLEPFPLLVIAPAESRGATDFTDLPLGDDHFLVPPVSAMSTGATASLEEAAVLGAPPPAVQSAVIPLPTPLYAALALLGIAAVARRLMLRVC